MSRTLRRQGLRAGMVAAALGLARTLPAQAEVTLRVPEDFATISEALDSAEWGDTILVGPGVYKESLILTDPKGDGVILKSTSGPAATTIAYGDKPDINEAVITFQRCSNSTQLIGFTIDGRGAARRGILVNSNSRPVLADLVITGAEYGLASHRNSYPYLQNVAVQGSRTAGLFIQGGSCDVRNCTFTGSEKFGVYIRGTADPVRMRNCRITENGQVGIQATEGEFSVEGALVSGNGDTGMILQDVSPLITDAEVAGHPNVGMVLEACWGTIRNCRIHDNNFGIVVSIEGEPKILGCTFEDNPSYHVGIEGEAAPLLGGAPENANRFLGEASFAVQSSSKARVVATHNYWGKPCAPKSLFQISGGGRIVRKPWMSGNLLKVFDDCDAARKYHKKWLKGKLDEFGEPLAKDQAANEGPVPPPPPPTPLPQAPGG